MTGVLAEVVDDGRGGVRETRPRLVHFDAITVSTERRYLVKGLIPRIGLSVIWGPPKSGKSYFTFDLMMHVALGWSYRGRRVHRGAVVYCAFEGQAGIEQRVEAFRKERLDAYEGEIPFFLEPVSLDLVREHGDLIAAIQHQIDVSPAAVVLDTLNRSLTGSESSDEDMSAYIKAADAIRDAFDCAVVVVHHCGVDGTRPRGHTSLSGAVEAQIAVAKDIAKNVVATVEMMKDGPEGESVTSRLERVVVGTDEDGDEITGCIVVEVEPAPAPSRAERLSQNQRTMFGLLHDAGSAGLTTEEWNAQAREVGIGAKRKATLHDIQHALLNKRMVRKTGDLWTVNHDG